MADLTKARLAYQSPAFTNTGVDYFGAFYVTVRWTNEKRWRFLFTCLTTRAVNVEVVPSMDTRSCVMGVERFVSRRGKPAMIWSDNRTNIIGAEKDLGEIIEKWNTINITAELAAHWAEVQSAQCAAPSWHLGEVDPQFWEGTVHHPRYTSPYWWGVEHYFFCLVEYALNARPLNSVSADPSNLGPITPNHFLLGNQATGTHWRWRVRSS